MDNRVSNNDDISVGNSISVMAEYDLIVVGGGVAGVSAAVQAKREGCHTLLLEKGVMLGGLATSGLIGYYLPLCDGEGRQVAAGLAEEILHLAIKYGYSSLDPYWSKQGREGSPSSRYKSAFAPMGLALGLDELIEQEQVDVLFDATFCKIVVRDDFDSIVVVETKDGRWSFKGKVVIDATGDADVLFRAGAPCVQGDNRLSYWGYTTSLEQVKMAAKTGNIQDAVTLITLGATRDGRRAPNLVRYNGTSPKDITRYILDGRRMLLDFVKGNKKGSIIPLTLAGMPQLRTIRRIRGLFELTSAHASKQFNDSIGCIGSPWEPGVVYELPYRSLVCQETPNMISAGRCISASGDAWEVTRVIPAVAVTGQAAGCAAAIAIERREPFSYLDVRVLQERLKASRVIIHRPN